MLARASWLPSFRRARSGADVLRAWLEKKAERAGEVLAVEEALLSGRFARYAFRRLAAFVLARGWGAALHVVELTWLAGVFSAKAFVASLALQNGALVVDAMFFGGLEAMRRRARVLGAGTDSSALVSRWLTASFWIAMVVVVVPLVQVVRDWQGAHHEPKLLHVYALVCAVRLAADVVIRTYYSGVFAFFRVYRPLWVPLVAPTVVVLGTVLFWKALLGWSFPAALLLSIVVSRAILFVYTHRAYRLRRIPQPHVRFRPRVRERGTRTLREAVLAGLANTTTRFGGVVLLAAVVPSLARPTFDDDAPEVEPFALALHLAAPLLFIAGQWGLVFYHDWKRIEGDEAAALSRHLHWRLIVTATVLAVFSWAAGSALIVWLVPWREVWLTLAALFPALLGLSIWTALQLRGFARGEFGRQMASAIAMLAALWLTLSSSILGAETWYVALAGGPWFAILLHALFSFVEGPHATGEVSTVATWIRALRLVKKEEVAVWHAQVVVRPPDVTRRIANHLGDRGAVVRTTRRLLWFERAPFTSKTDWLRLTGGALARLDGGAGDNGPAQISKLEAIGRLGRPEVDAKVLRTLEATHSHIFPDGFLVRVGRPPPKAFLALKPSERQALWRDALRAERGNRGLSGWFVTSFAPGGATEAFFATKGPITSQEGTSWYAEINPHRWRILTNDPDVSSD